MQPRVIASLCAISLLAAGGCGSSKSSSSESSASNGSASITSSSSSTSSPKGGKLESSITFTKGKTPKWATVPASAPVHSGAIPISYHNITINPDAIKVKAGSTITWTNEDPLPHNVTSVGPGPMKFASGNFGEGQTFKLTMTKPGVIHYESTNYPTTMNATIVVVK